MIYDTLLQWRLSAEDMDVMLSYLMREVLKVVEPSYLHHGSNMLSR